MSELARDPEMFGDTYTLYRVLGGPLKGYLKT